MNISAVVDRIENGKAILLSNEFGIEISIQANLILGQFKEGEVISLTIDKNGNIENI